MAHSLQHPCVKRIVIIDCHNIPVTDTRLLTVLNALKNAVKLNGRLADPEWTHFGLIVIRDNKCDVLLPMQSWKSITTVSLMRVFNQTQELLLEEINTTDDTHLNKSLKKEYLLKGLENACSQIKKTRQERVPGEIILITFNWEDQCGEHFKQYFEQHLKQDAIQSVQIVDLTCCVKVSSIHERVSIHSFQPLTLDIGAESFFKSWINIRRRVVTINFQQEPPFSLCGQLRYLHIDPYALESSVSAESGADITLHVKARIAVAQISQELLHNACRVLVPEPSKANVEGWKALWQQLEDSNVALMSTSDNFIHSSLLLPGQDYALIVQPFVQDATPSEKLNENAVAPLHHNVYVPSLRLRNEFGASRIANI